MARRARRLLIGMSAAIALLISIGAGAAFGSIVWAQRLLDQGPAISLTTTSVPNAQGVVNGTPCSRESCNFLLLGSDSRNGLPTRDQQGFVPSSELGGYNSDTILLVHLDAATKHATIVSFPRDLWVRIPGFGMNKINAAFAIGASRGGVTSGAALTAQTVSNLTGMQINHELVVDLEGFVKIVDEMGGVPFCTPTSLRDDPQAYGESRTNLGSGLNMPLPGCYQLTGEDALALVRARYVVAGNGQRDCVSDFSRISRQQQFLRSVLNTLLSPSELPSLPSLVPTVVGELVHDKGLKVTDLVDLATSLEGVASGAADFRTVPGRLGTEKTPAYSFKLDVVHKLPAADELFSRLRHNQPLGDLGKAIAYTPPSPADISVRVFDDDSDGKAQRDVYTANLANAGFQMMSGAAEPAADLAGSSNTILYAPGSRSRAEIVAGYVPGIPVRKAAAGSLPSGTQVAVVINAEYEHRDPGEGTKQPTPVKC